MTQRAWPWDRTKAFIPDVWEVRGKTGRSWWDTYEEARQQQHANERTDPDGGPWLLIRRVAAHA
jgi:hypothetical protein